MEHVDIERCRRAGDHARADELQAKRDAQIGRMRRSAVRIAGGRRKQRSPSWHEVRMHVRNIRGKRVVVKGFERGA